MQSPNMLFKITQYYLISVHAPLPSDAGSNSAKLIEKYEVVDKDDFIRSEKPYSSKILHRQN